MEEEESNLVAHARRELVACGQYDEDPAFAESIIAAVRGFATYYGHSGGSAAVGSRMVYDLLQFKALAPVTASPDEWIDVAEQSGYTLFRNRRQSTAFSEDGGQTYYDIDEPLSWWRRAWWIRSLRDRGRFHVVKRERRPRHAALPARGASA